MIAPVITIDSESRTYRNEKKNAGVGPSRPSYHSKLIGPTVIDYELNMIDLIIDKTYSAYCMELGERFPKALQDTYIIRATF